MRIISTAWAEYIAGLQSLKWWSEADAAAYVRIGPRQFRRFTERTRMRFKATPEGRLFRKAEVDRAMLSILEYELPSERVRRKPKRT